MPSHERIKSHFDDSGISMQELARRVQELQAQSGRTKWVIDGSDISKILRGLRRVMADEVPLFAAALDCEILDLMDPKPPSRW